jgi:hypothetical protein
MVTAVVRMLALGMLLACWSAPASAERWKSCPKGPDGKCVRLPCEPFLADIRALAAYRRKADDPRCPGQARASALADQQQQKIDQIEAKMATTCIAQAVPIIRRVASIDVQRSDTNAAGQGVAVVRYTNNTEDSIRSATVTCSAMRADQVVATGKAIVPGPIAPAASRSVQVAIDLAGATFECVECDLTSER